MGWAWYGESEEEEARDEVRMCKEQEGRAAQKTAEHRKGLASSHVWMYGRYASPSFGEMAESIGTTRPRYRNTYLPQPQSISSL